MCNNVNTIFEALKWGQGTLAEVKIENALQEAEILLAFSLGQSRGEIYLNFPLPISQEKLNFYQSLIFKRAGNYPLQYIVGEQEFMSLCLKVTPDVLIPRQDTEILVEKVLYLAKEINAHKILDIGTGSGAIAISLAKNIVNCQICASDISSGAITVASYNAQNLGQSVIFKVGNLFEPFKGEKFDIIVSNPPYIRSGEIKNLMPEVSCYEPITALDGGSDGLFIYQQIINQAPNYLNNNGYLAFEIGFDQAIDLNNILVEPGMFDKIKLYQDYGGRDRVVTARFRY